MRAEVDLLVNWGVEDFCKAGLDKDWQLPIEETVHMQVSMQNPHNTV